MKYDDKDKVEGLTFSATGLAYSYSQTGFPYAKEMWESMVEVLNPDLTKGLVDEPHPVATRSELIMNAIKDSGITQMVEFASGWSTHGLHLCKNNPDFKYIEVLYKNDELGIDEAEEKRQVLANLGEKIGGIPSNYHTIGGDVLDEQTFEQVAALLDQKQVAATNVGLMTYFSPEQKEKFAQNVKALLQEFGGKWITQDLRVTTMHPNIKAILEKQTGTTVGTFESQEEVDAFLEKVGLEGKFLSDNKVEQKLKKVNYDEERAQAYTKFVSIDVNKGGDK